MIAPTAQYFDDRYVFHWTDAQIDLSMERLHEARGGDLTAEVEVVSTRPDVTGLLHHARLNLISTRSRQDIVRTLCQRIPEDEVDWGGAVELACHLAIKRWREGDPVVDLRCVQPRTGSRFLLEPYVEYGGPTILFADGGTGKSLFALAIATSIAAGVKVFDGTPAECKPALYLDWESDADTHHFRLKAICAGLGIDKEHAPVFYRRQSSSLAESAPYIRRIIAERQIGFVVVDSMGGARGGEPESADATIRLFNAARTLNVPWLGVDHLSKTAVNTGEGNAKPFGSVFTHNMARLTWALEKVEDLGGGRMTLGLTNHKANNGLPERRRGYSVAIDADEDKRPIRVAYAEEDVREMPGMFAQLSQPQQIADILARNRGSMTVEDIQRALEADGVIVKADTLRVVLNRHKGRFVSIPDGKTVRWGLRAYGQ